MFDLSFSTNIFALSAQVAILAQASIICLLVLVNLPTKTVTSFFGRLSILLVWLAVLLNLFIDFPDNLDLWLNSLAIFLLFTHGVKCLAQLKAISRYSTQPLKSCLMILLFGVLHQEHWQNSSNF